MKYCGEMIRNIANSKCFITIIKGDFSFSKNMKSSKLEKQLD